MAETARVAMAASAASVFLMALPFQESRSHETDLNHAKTAERESRKSALLCQNPTLRLNDQ
jgi:hypothetical protein